MNVENPDQRRAPWLVYESLRVLAGNRSSLAGGLPALLVGGAVAVLAFHVATTPEDQRLAPYARGAALGTESRGFDSALLCNERLIQELGADPTLYYAHAMILRAKGDLAAAAPVLSRLAPTDQPGYPPAHLALAGLLLDGGGRDERTLHAVELHLRYALEGSDDGDEAGAMLGRLYAATGRGEKAEPYLLKAADRHPELLLVLARLARERGNEPGAQGHLDRASGVFRQRAEARLDDPEARLLWAAAAAARPDFAAAVAILEQGLKRSADPRYGPALAGTYAAWADGRARDGSSTPGDRLALLERGLSYDPNSPALLDRLADAVRTGGPEVDRVRSVLQAQLTDGKATPTTHFVLGLDAFSRGRGDEARLHWEQAFRLDPGMPIVANNLAWVLAHADPPDLTRALELADRAVQRQPNNLHFRGTRGVVLMKLRRWPEALTDLEAELAGNPDRVETHLALAQVYENLGSPELTSRHRDRAKAVQKPTPLKGVGNE